MELTETEKALKDLCDKLKTDLEHKIKEAGHYGEGKLSKSIQFIYKKKNKNEYTIHFQANDYIQYLDKGKFFKDFMKEKKLEIQKVLAENFHKDIFNELLLLNK